MAITLHDVAKLAGVSFKTVSNVVNDHPHVREATRVRVQAAIDELRYQPNVSARHLRSGRSGVIGLAVPELSLAYFAQLADEVIQAAEKRGLVVLIEQTGGDRDRELEVLRSPRLQLIDGLLFSPLGLGIDDAALVDIDTPLVLLGERIFHGPADHVTMRNVEAAQAATEHLIGLGRQRIAVLGAHEGEVIGSAGLRLTGYRQALDAAGIPFDESLVAHVGLWHRANGAEGMRRLLADGAQFDGLFAMSDELALGAMRMLQEAGLVIPSDVAIVGFDDIDEGRYSIPSLSTIDPGRSEIAETAIDVLMDRIGEKGKAKREPEESLSAFRLVVRESSSG
ncbi:LacI family DNA-binding transcriptional regulator [Demequina lutea]|uniref:DNA-binding LacI/PurR family transcriptional regulator n=1 Tax=Demequina lutea TaxID=431489 RepID=A0A7Y9Z9P6_9MICO|nr:LacI family DNA-binding transcriptional regulator [Demequina lutea]NYI40090.1 DNA-binding LacI/PurR family transcriptional regulator [Demequina lutea]